MPWLSLLKLTSARVTEISADEWFGGVGGFFHGHAAEVASLHASALFDEIDELVGSVTAGSFDDIEILTKKGAKVKAFGNLDVGGHDQTPGLMGEK